MKRFTVFIFAALVTLPLLGAADIFLKFDTIPGDATQPGHAGWFEISSFSWGASQPGAQACATTHTLAFTRKGPVSERLTQLCKQHAQMPSMTVDSGGERHLLQNVAFAQCTSEAAGGGNAFESYTLNFGRCATHANAAMNNIGVKGIGAADIKMNAPNAILIGLSPRPEAAALLALNFMGPNAAKLTRRQAAGNPSALDELARSHQKIPTFSITLNNGQKWTFTDVMVSSFTGGVHPGAASFSLNFSNVQGPLTGYQDISYKE
ncbi:MAG TPA: type VI secretion system tube protein Hcp [Thermoanaerobaculia bacterium]|nr:type VI secretion system tube protein Hcp [Thermoanaerobaculia bacterium]